MGHTSEAGRVTETVPSITARAPLRAPSVTRSGTTGFKGAGSRGVLGGSRLTRAVQPALRRSVHATPSPLTALPLAATLRAPSADGVHLTYGSSGVWRPEGRDVRQLACQGHMAHGWEGTVFSEPQSPEHATRRRSRAGCGSLVCVHSVPAPGSCCPNTPPSRRRGRKGSGREICPRGPASRRSRRRSWTVCVHTCVRITPPPAGSEAAGLGHDPITPVCTHTA